MTWEAACNGGWDGKARRPWFLYNADGVTLPQRYGVRRDGQFRKFSTRASAQREADKLNRANQP